MKLRIVLFAFMFAVLSASMSLVAYAYNDTASLSDEGGKIVDIEYLEPVQFSELSAKPGETVSQEMKVPVRILYENGESRNSFETVTFTISNQFQESDIVDAKASALMGINAGQTSVTCYGTLNATGRNFTAKVKWRYDAGLSIAWHDSNTYTTFSATSPYTTYEYAGSPPSGPGSNLYVTTQARYYKDNLFKKSNKIEWQLQGSTGNCNATGYVLDSW